MIVGNELFKQDIITNIKCKYFVKIFIKVLSRQALVKVFPQNKQRRFYEKKTT